MDEYLPFISNLFKKYGVKSISMDDIARELKKSKKTLYKHFENKEDVVYQVAQFEIKNEFSELTKLCIRHEHAINELLMISKYIIQRNFSINSSLIFSMTKYYPHIWEGIMRERKESILNFIKQNIQKGIEQNIYRIDINFNVISIFYSFLLDIKSIEMYNDEFKDGFEKVFNLIFMYHIRGIATQNGIEYFEKQFIKLNN
ncbi:MAG: TetR/AcrR family transcriptional regulator [Bacteroidales bacterium]|jgi:AcrR family transcriptional regulator|nr:TetR/AcrR family transcriptional regulator [Bacteroidales bacterium]MBN2820372.1 TetR/AcrR family transcriptional regulator [Bacteroidales bacterium]